MPRISLIMCVRDEETTLAAAVQSVASVVDEVVIGVDDACVDDTPQIARSLASPGRLFSFHFEDDFSAIRNEAIKRANGDLCLVLDGHEYIAGDDHPSCVAIARMRGYEADQRVPTPLSTLAYIKEHGLQGDAVCVCLSTLMNIDPAGIPQLFFLQPRMFVNNGSIRYQNKVHNALTGYKREQTIAYRDILLIHQMPAAREEKRKVQRKAMNASGLHRDIIEARKAEKAYRKEHGTEMPVGLRNGRPWFYMGNTYADQGEHKKALYWYEQYLPRSGFGDEKYQAYQQLAIMTHRVKHDTNAAIEYTQKAEQLCWNRAEPYVLRAEICMDNKDWEQALHWLGLAESFPCPDTVMFLQGPVYSYLPSILRARCYQEMQNWPKAIGELENVLTWRPGDPEIVEQILICRNKLRKEQAPPNMMFVDRIGSFTAPMAQFFADKGWAVVKREQCDMRWKGWADIAFFEWCDAGIVEWSQHKWECPVVCRLHSYELYTDYPGQVNWNNVDHLIFVSEHIRRLVLERWPHIAKQTKTSVIFNGIDPAKYKWTQHGPGRKVAFLGYINSKKNVAELAALCRAYPDYEFHVGGKPQEGNIWDDFRFQIADLHNVWFHGWIENTDDWLDDMDYLVSPSIIESFGYTICEAALKGIKPIVRHRLGAADLWPATWIYKGVEDFRRVLEGPYDPEFNRQWIVDRYSLDRQLTETDALIRSLLAGYKTNLSDDYKYHTIVNCLGIDGAGHSTWPLSTTTEPANAVLVV